MSAARPTRLVIYRGEKKVWAFSAEGGPDVAAWTISFRVADVPDGTRLLTLTTGSGVGSQGPGGAFAVTVSAAQSAALTFGLKHWSVFRTDADNETFLAGGELAVLDTAHTSD